MNSYKIIVNGRVQGVFFRDYTSRVAHKFGIKGYVKNLYNGNVEIVAKADEQSMEQFLEKVKIGPPAARVKSIDIQELNESIEYETFKITY